MGGPRYLHECLPSSDSTIIYVVLKIAVSNLYVNTQDLFKSVTFVFIFLHQLHVSIILWLKDCFNVYHLHASLKFWFKDSYPYIIIFEAYFKCINVCFCSDVMWTSDGDSERKKLYDSVKDFEFCWNEYQANLGENIPSAQVKPLETPVFHSNQRTV